VRVAVGAGVFAVGQPESAPVAPAAAAGATDQKLPAYNAYEFTYRSDFGKIILLEQNVETGQEITQVPTEYHLQQYAASQRAQRLQQQEQLFQGSSGNAGKTAGAVAATAAVKSAALANAGGSGATGKVTSSAPAPAAPAAPALAAGAGASPHVDIQV
jgi:hypothetical protein